MALEYRQIAPAHAVRRAIRVLETIDRHHHGVDADQLCREADIPSAELAPLLAMLRREGYVRHLPGGAYVLGESAVMLGDARRKQSLGARIKAVLAQLRDELGAAVYFSRYDDGEVRIIDFADGPTAPRVNEWVDFRYSGHASAIGKCLLTQLDTDRRREHVARHKTARFTSKTITNERALFAALDSQPATVPTLDLQEYAVGTVCAAVPVTLGEHVGCLATSMPVDRAHRLKAAAEALNRRAAPVLLSLAI